MKKATAIVLLFLFLITNSGMAFSAHWCGGKLASIDFFSADNHPCKCGKRVMKHGCCKDKITHLKASNELNKTNKIVFNFTVFKFNCIQLNPIELLPVANFQYLAVDIYHPPPYKSKSPIYLLDKVFLI